MEFLELAAGRYSVRDALRGLPSSIGESLEQACAVHGLDVDEVLQSINEYLSAKKADV